MKLNLDSIKKLILLVVLIVLICSLSIYYADNVNYHGLYPSTIDVISHYPQGQVVSISGTVFSYEKNGFLVGENYQGKVVYYNVISNITVYPGDYISFNGILGPDYNVTIVRSEVVSPWSYTFELLRSFSVVPFLLIFFVLYWRFDLDRLVFIRRK